MCTRPDVIATADRIRAIDGVLNRFGAQPLGIAARAGIRIVALDGGERYRDRSRALRRLAAAVDDWPVPPAGLFVVEERTVYLRSLSMMTIAHEFAHAIDCALGDGCYVSGRDPRIRRAFAGARGFVTPYAASALDEYFAESLRAFVGVNDPRSPWPRATRARLRAIDPTMEAILAAYLSRPAG